MSHGFALGIDFRGGTLMTITAPQPIDGGALRHALQRLNLGEVQVQGTTCTRDDHPYCALVQLPDARTRSERGHRTVQQHIQALSRTCSFVSVEGGAAKVSDELFGNGLIALGLGDRS